MPSLAVTRRGICLIFLSCFNELDTNIKCLGMYSTVHNNARAEQKDALACQVVKKCASSMKKKENENWDPPTDVLSYLILITLYTVDSFSIFK